MTPLEIRRLRHSLQWTQTQLAAHVGISQALVSAWESGARTPSAPAQRMLAQLAELVVQPTPAPTETPRQRILDVALELIAREGVNTLRFDRIGQEAGLTRSGVEHHFPTRRALIDGLLQAYQTTILDDFEDRCTAEEARGNPHPGVHAYVDQGFSELDTTPAAPTQRAALLAALIEGDETTASLRTWAEDISTRALERSHTEVPVFAHIAMLLSDAVWLLELLNLRTFSDDERNTLRNAAFELIERG